MEGRVLDPREDVRLLNRKITVFCLRLLDP